MKKNKIKNKTHTLIISDLHLGSKVSRANTVTKLLENFQFKKLILLGDIFEELDFTQLKKNDWDFLSLLGKLSQTKKIRWVEGNHDKNLSKIFAGLTGAKVYNVYRWQYKKKKYLAIHGHQFDNFLINNAFLSYLATLIYRFIQLVDFSDKKISRFIKRKSKGWLRLSDKVAKRALLYARLRRANYIFCGHTHKALKKKRGKIFYYNSGCWTDVPSAYITIDEEDIQINEYY